MKAEIDDVIGRDSLPKMADKSRLPYCSAVVLESMRLGNVVPLSLPHRVSEDIFHKNLRIPKGSFIVPSLDSVVHDENLFPDSFEFKPVLVFSLGKRVCPGEAIVHMELFLYLTSLVQQFKFVPPEGDEPPMVKGVLGITHSPSPYKLIAVPWD